MALFFPPVQTPAQWFGMTIQGKPVGYWSHAVRRQTDGLVQTRDSMLFVINRLGAKLSIASDTTYLESSDGRLVSVDSTDKSSGQATREQVTFKDSVAEILRTVGARQYRTQEQFTQPPYGPEFIRRESLRRLVRVRDSGMWQTFSPLISKVENQTVRLSAMTGSQKTVQIAFADIPGAQTSVYSSSGELIEMEQDSPLGMVKMLPETEAEAMAPDGGAELPGGFFEATLAKSNIRLPDPRSISEVTLRLEEKSKIDLPPLGSENQSEITRTGPSVELRVESQSSFAKKPGAEYLAPNSLIQADDPAIQKLAKEFLTESNSRFAAAVAAHDWLAARARLDGGIVEAPASETVKTCKGTCYAFAILLAALERAIGLPSKVAMGYVYEQGIWGGHAWTEVWNAGRWVRLDSAMYSRDRADAARFAFATSSMANGSSALSANGLAMFGKLKVTVLSYRTGDRLVKVGPTAKPYVVTGATYRNPWLGLRVNCPDAFRFTGLGGVYPDSSIVSLTDREGDEVSVGTHSGGPSGIRYPSDSNGQPARIGGYRGLFQHGRGDAAFSFTVGQAEWQVTATGPKASQAVKELMRGLSIR